jgi:hypothetical protein
MTSWSASADMATPWLEPMFEYSSAPSDAEADHRRLLPS